MGVVVWMWPNGTDTLNRWKEMIQHTVILHPRTIKGSKVLLILIMSSHPTPKPQHTQLLHGLHQPHNLTLRSRHVADAVVGPIDRLRTGTDPTGDRLLPRQDIKKWKGK